jgi:hypothetical protein
VGFGFFLKFLLAPLWVKIQHARPLAQERMSELWLGYIHVGTGSGFRIHFEISISTIVGEDPACSSPCSRENECTLAWL